MLIHYIKHGSFFVLLIVFLVYTPVSVYAEGHTICSDGTIAENDEGCTILEWPE